MIQTGSRHTGIFSLFTGIAFTVVNSGSAMCAERIDSDISKERVAVYAEYGVRLNSIGDRLLAALDPRPDEKTYVTLPFVTVDRHEDAQNKTSISDNEGVIVSRILSPIDGINENDTLVAVDGVHIDSVEHLARVLSQQVNGLDRILLRLSRRGEEFEKVIRLDPKPVSAIFAISFRDGEMTSAQEAGVITLSPALYHYLETDDEIAFLLAHEIAHLYFGHRREQINDTRADAAVGMTRAILGAAVGAQHLPPPTIHFMDGPYSEAAEMEADKYATILLSRAGYDSHAGYDVLARIVGEEAKTNDRYSRHYSQVHPLGISRVAALKENLSSISPHNLRMQDNKPKIIATEALGAVPNSGADQSEFRLRQSEMKDYDGTYGGDARHIFYDNTQGLMWEGVISEKYEWMKNGKISVELIDPTGDVWDRCDSSYSVAYHGTTWVACKGLRIQKRGESSPRSGAWTVRVIRTGKVIDVRKIWIEPVSRFSKFTKKRSEIVWRRG